MFLPGQPFQGLEGLIGSGAVPPPGWSQGDGVGRDQFLSPETIAGRGDGHALFETPCWSLVRLEGMQHLRTTSQALFYKIAPFGL